MLIASASNLEQLKIVIEYDLKLIFNWFRENELTENVSKTHFLFIENQRNIREMYEFSSIRINNEDIKRVKTRKYLGLLIDAKLTWKRFNKI